MTEQKINALINAQTRENNYLALCLMIELLNFSFQEAFLRLKLYKESTNVLYLEIAEVTIRYDVHFFRAIEVPSDWAEIKRQIYHQEQAIQDGASQINLDEGDVWGLEHGEDQIEQLKYILDDLKSIIPKIEALLF